MVCQIEDFTVTFLCSLTAVLGKLDYAHLVHGVKPMFTVGGELNNKHALRAPCTILCVYNCGNRNDHHHTAGVQIGPKLTHLLNQSRSKEVTKAGWGTI